MVDLKQLSDSEYFAAVHKRLGMFIGSPSLGKAEAFIQGYRQHAYRHDADVFDGWHDWMLARLDGPCCHSWSGIVTHLADGTPCECSNGRPETDEIETRAIDLMFELLVEYLGEREANASS